MSKKIVAGLAVVLIVFLALLARAYARHRISTYPGIESVGGISLGRTITVSDVQINRPWIRGVVQRVEIDTGLTGGKEQVRLIGGRVHVALDKRQDNTSENGSRPIVVKEMAGTVSFGEERAEFSGLNSRDGDLCADSISFSRGQVRAELKSVCFGARSFASGVVSLNDLPDSPIALTDGSFSLADKTVNVREASCRYGGAKGLAISETNVDADSIVYKGRTFSDVSVIPGEHITVSVGGVYLSFTKDFRRLWGEGSCQGWFEAMPHELRVPVMDGMRFAGKLSFDIDISSGQLEIQNTCRLEASSCSGLSELRSKFEYVPLGTDTPVLTGPKTKSWVRYKYLSSYLIEAATTLEDPGFFQHRGFSLPSLRVVLKETAERGSFYRGGSTITQQTAKNLWLSSSKTLDRKAQEAFLTVALESCLTKEQILETYFNVIEYGPGVYGIGKAARTLFGVSPRELTQLEAFHLVRILPNPKRALPPDQGGLDQTRALLKSLVKHRGLTTETDWIE